MTAGIRSEFGGENLVIPANATRSVYLPDGKYYIFFVHSNHPTALFQGDNVTLNGNGAEIRIGNVVRGNYAIRRVR